ncbi:MAG: hypothetical protein V1717_01915 [Candidatus Micrarchaeota archaeon]
MQVKTDLQGLKQTVPVAPSEALGKQWTYTPVWLPVQTEGKPVVKVSTRQDFLGVQLGEWRAIQISRAAAVALGIGALYFLSSNILISAGLGLSAGWAWGTYAKKAFFFEFVNKRREILEGT